MNFTSIHIAASLHQIVCMDTLGKRIKELRDAAQLTQAELAALSLKSVETISNFERGKTIPSVQTLTNMADKLNVSVCDFFDNEPPQSTADPLDIAIQNKTKLLSDDDKKFVADFISLLVARS